MKTISLKAVTLTFLLAVLLSSCNSSKSVLKEMMLSRADLYYELNKPQYLGEIKENVYLDFIDYSNMDYYTSVKKKSFFLVPLILFNHCAEGFEAKLGERSLTMNFREFLTDAFVAECNNSTCFNLISNADGSVSADSVYTLKVKILQNTTKAKLKLRESCIFFAWGQEEDSSILVGFENHKLKPAVTDLTLNTILLKNNKKIFEKEYMISKSYHSSGKSRGDLYMTSTACLNRMAENLSMATKEIVEEISEELHLVMQSNF